MRKTLQDKMFDRALKLLPHLSNEDLAVIVIACEQIVQARVKEKKRILGASASPRAPAKENGARITTHV